MELLKKSMADGLTSERTLWCGIGAISGLVLALLFLSGRWSSPAVTKSTSYLNEFTNSLGNDLPRI
jgi:hypothetical protein